MFQFNRLPWPSFARPTLQVGAKTQSGVDFHTEPGRRTRAHAGAVLWVRNEKNPPTEFRWRMLIDLLRLFLNACSLVHVFACPCVAAAKLMIEFWTFPVPGQVNFRHQARPASAHERRSFVG